MTCAVITVLGTAIEKHNNIHERPHTMHAISNQTLLFQVVVRLAVVDITLFVLKLLHRLLFKDLISAFAFEFLCDWNTPRQPQQNKNETESPYVLARLRSE